MIIEAMKQALEVFDAPILADEFEQAMRLRKACDALRQAIEQAEEQKPVGQLQEETFGRGQVFWFDKPKDNSFLYTKPPQEDWEAVAADQAMTIAMMRQREWVGLTDSEIMTIAESSFDWNEYTRAIEAKLKEKNCEPRQYKDLCDND